jgi:hypothetical protein
MITKIKTNIKIKKRTAVALHKQYAYVGAIFDSPLYLKLFSYKKTIKN